MTRYRYSLDGIQPTPLSDYLKAIGILRIVATQVDKLALGWWSENAFWLMTKLNQEQLCEFFLNDYQPTPLIAPWNGGSGFFAADQKGAWHRGFEPLMKSTAARFAPYREAIEAGKTLLGDRDVKFDGKESGLKEALLQRAAQNWRGPLADWLHAALSIGQDGSPVYPAMLGTGGNDGRLDFTNNLMQRLAELFDLESPDATPGPQTEAFIREAILGKAVTGMRSAPIGQFAPGAAGGVNSSVGFRSSPQVNPFDFILMLEGAIAFSPSIVRRATARPLPQAAAPFAVYSGLGGHSSSVPEEKSRGEQWMPLWNQPTSFAELKQVLKEARCRVGTQKAQRPRDVAQAIARCGVSRGISGFERFGYLERNGQANLAVSLGRWNVSSSTPFVELLSEIDSWVDGLERAARGANAPASWSHHAKVINDSLMQCCRSTATARSWQQLLAALGEAEANLVQNPRAVATSRIRPLFYGRRGLSPRWILAACGTTTNVDELAELRLAVALASQSGPVSDSRQRQRGNWNDPLRRHVIPLQQSSGQVRRPHAFASSDDSLNKLIEVVVAGVDPIADLIAIVQRRIQMADRRNDWHHLPIVPTASLEATLPDLSRWIDGELDEQRIVSMARALMAIDWDDAWRQRKSIAGGLLIAEARKMTASGFGMLAGWSSIRLCYHWNTLQINLQNAVQPELSIAKDQRIAIDPKIIAHLIGGRPDVAIQLASRRLMASGLPVRIHDCLVDAHTARRWAASLAWGISDFSINQLAARIVHRAGVDLEPSTLS